MNTWYARSLLFTVVLTIGIEAQSILSVNDPIGLPRSPESGMAMNMGGTAIGIRNDHNLLLANPANLGGIRTTAFSSLLSLDGLHIGDAGGTNNYLAVVPAQISFAFPLDIMGTMAFSLCRESDATVKYRVQAPIGLDYTGRISLDRRGGLTSWQVGWGRSIGKYLSAGLAYQRLNLTIRNTKLVDLIGATTTTTTRDSTTIAFSGNGLRAGIMGTYRKFTAGISLDYDFNGGLNYSRGEYRGTQTTTFDSSGYDSSAASTMALPMTIGAGISFQFSPEWLAGMDVKITNWDSFSSGGLLPEKSLRTAAGFSAGTQFIPAPDLLAPRYWETIHYRAGVRATQLPVEGTNEFALSLGAGLPLLGDGLLDLVVEGGNRWDSRFSNYNETFFSFAIGINGGRTWNKSGTGTY
jgi:hypothetical protein